MKFEQAVEIILQLEGGYENDPRDPGGETNFGIDKKSHPSVDIRNLTREGAIEIYRQDYWEHPRVELLPELLRLSFFDTCINQGTHTAAEMLQKVVGVKQDGVIGNETLRAVEKHPKVLSEFLGARAYRYATSRNFEIYGKGWLNRLLDIAVISGRNS
jgi:lysozyme family protein